MSLNCPKGDEPCIRGCRAWECRDGWPEDLVTCGGGPPGDPNGQNLSAATMEMQRIRMALGWEPGDGPPPDPVAVIQMLRGWEVDAQRRADLMEKHLRAVLEVARTWQPDYASKMDRDTLQHAEDFADRKTPNVRVEGPP